MPRRLAIRALADQCVKCGLCLPRCPTYRQTQHEADSPRGRIALIQGWAEGLLDPTPALTAHLDGCLVCRACERACPSQVDYGWLIVTARAWQYEEMPAWRRWPGRWGRALLSHAPVMYRLARLADGYRTSGLAAVVARLGLNRLPGLAPYLRLASVLAGRAARIPARPADGAAFELFMGCMDTSAQGRATAAALRVCDWLGLRVHVASEPRCCGALARHRGDLAAAARARSRLAQRDSRRPLVGLASACVAELRENPALGEVLEFCAVLDRQTWPTASAIRPLPGRALIHTPCSHRRLPDGNAAVRRLLERIPALELRALPDDPGCCGAAGTYLLHRPRMAQALLAETLAPVLDWAPDWLVTTNPGCALHLAAGLREAGLATRVCHPVELLAGQLD